MRNCLTLFTLLLFISLYLLKINNLHAQTSWQTYQTIDQVQIEYSEPFICSFSEDKVKAEYIFLRIRNLSNATKKISFRVDHFYKDSGCGTCNNDEYKYSFNLPANSIIEADCEFTVTGLNKLALFKKYINRPNKREFEKFEISNITIE